MSEQLRLSTAATGGGRYTRKDSALTEMATMIDAAAERIGGPKPQPVVGAELLDVRAVAAPLGGCSTRHLYRLADAGRMPRPIKLGTLIRWRRAELMRWIAEDCPPIRSTKCMAG